MIFFNKGFGKRFALIMLYYLFIVFITLYFDNCDLWGGFSARFFVYQFSVVFLIGNTLIDEYFNYYSISRFGSRRIGILNHMLYDFVYTVVMVSELFVFLMILTLFMKGRNYVESIEIMIDYYFRYLFTAYLLTNVSRIFSHTKFNIFKGFPQLCAFLVLLSDVLVVYPVVHRDIGLYQIKFFFSWILSENTMVCYIMLGLWNVLTLVYLYFRCEQEDLI